MEPAQTILLNSKIITLTEKFDRSIFEGISPNGKRPENHQEVCDRLRGKRPYTITIILDRLFNENRNKKKYVKKTKYAKQSLYIKHLYEAFYREFGSPFRQSYEPGWADQQANNKYSKWLEQYRPLWEKEGRKKAVDDYIIELEFEPRYKEKILKKFKNHENLFRKQFRIDKDRYYHLPEPFSHVDWRSPYDNLFIWEENGRKIGERGGSGSSGAREMNSKFILGLLALNKTDPVPSYVFLYTGDNRLLFIHRFETLHVPPYDIGSNYPELSSEECNQLVKTGKFLKWDSLYKLEKIKTLHGIRG